MLPHEFTIKGPPVSVQTRKKARLRSWKDAVRDASIAAVAPGAIPVRTPVAVVITYYYDGVSPDVDNILKPMLDALKGVVFDDDAQVIEAKSRKRSIDGSYKIRGASSVLLQAFATGDDFVHIRVIEGPVEEVLD